MNLRTLSHLPDDLGTLGAPAVINPADEAGSVKEPATPFERYMRSTTLPDNWERALEQTFDAGRTLGREEMREAERQAGTRSPPGTEWYDDRPKVRTFEPGQVFHPSSSPSGQGNLPLRSHRAVRP